MLNSLLVFHSFLQLFNSFKARGCSCIITVSSQFKNFFQPKRSPVNRLPAAESKGTESFNLHSGVIIAWKSLLTATPVLQKMLFRLKRRVIQFFLSENQYFFAYGEAFEKLEVFHVYECLKNQKY